MNIGSLSLCGCRMQFSDLFQSLVGCGDWKNCSHYKSMVHTFNIMMDVKRKKDSSKTHNTKGDNHGTYE